MEKLIRPNRDLGLLILRLFIALRLIYGVADNIISWKHMLEFSEFLTTFNFPLPKLSAILSVYIQFLGGLFLLIGFKTRLSAFILAINFLIALLFVHVVADDSVEQMTPALALFFGSITLLFTGAGKFSLDK